MQNKKRWGSLDVLRLTSFFLIFIYHFMVETEAGGYYSFSQHGITYETPNLHIAKIGVVLFFMMSGFGLMGGSFSLKEYGKKRFERIFIPYYVVSAFVLFCAMILSSEPVFAGSVPKWHIIFTVLGIDGYLSEYGVPTFHLGIGEWFVGCMILMYLVYPLLRKAMLKKPNMLIMVSTAVYLLLLLFYKGTVPVYYFFPVKLYDFILGMYLAVKIKEPSVKTAVISFALMLGFFMFPIKLPLSDDYPNVILGLLTFLFVFSLEDIKKVKRIFECRIFKDVAACSYEMFLIHHWGIIMINQILQPQTPGMIWICFIVEGIVILFAGRGLHDCIHFFKRKCLPKV